jgi:hypothetical protein
MPIEAAERGRELVNEVIYDPRLWLAIRKQGQLTVAPVIAVPRRSDQAGRSGRLIQDRRQPSLLVELQDVVPRPKARNVARYEQSPPEFSPF